MSRIALQIFLAFFFSLVLMAITSTAMTSWSLKQQEEAIALEIRRHAGSAALALAEQGSGGLLDWARTQEESSDDWTVLIFDEWGEEILGRSLPAPAALVSSSTLPGFPLSPWLDTPSITIDLGRESPVLINEFGERYQLLPVPRKNSGWLQRLQRDFNIMLWSALLALTFLISLLLARFLTRPVIDLRSTMRQLAAGELSSRVPPRTAKRKDELGELGRSLDEMTQQLQQLIADRERLLGDISHELRSPLARMRLATALLEQSNNQTETNHVHLARIEREIARLDELIGGILNLSRLENIRLEQAANEIGTEDDADSLSKPVDLLPALERMFEDAKFESLQHHKDFEFELPSTAILVRAPGDWLAAAIENVLRNAIRHTPPAGTVRARFTQIDGEYLLQVFNPGTNIPEDQLSKIFEPFFRLEPDRARDSGGVGLGLAIASRAIRAHGGSIYAHNIPATADGPNGVKMELRWPRLPETKL
ncbi:MAG: ATP-binding protein [Steroidobacteraceae bacterium]